MADTKQDIKKLGMEIIARLIQIFHILIAKIYDYAVTYPVTAYFIFT